MNITSVLNEAIKTLKTEDGEFIHNAYLLALHRRPDKQGGHHYLRQLCDGRSKSMVLSDLFLSPESRFNWSKMDRKVERLLILGLVRGLTLPKILAKSLRINGQRSQGRTKSSTADRLTVSTPLTANSEVDCAHPTNMDELLDLLIRWDVFLSKEDFHNLYGRLDGFNIINDLKVIPPKLIILLCPSFGKECGIGEYAEHLKNSIQANDYHVITIRRSSEAFQIPTNDLRDAQLIVNHGPGLFDGYNPQLSEGESTHTLISNLTRLHAEYNVRPVFYLHSLLDSGNQIMFGRQCAILTSGFPCVTTISSAATTFRLPQVEHGIQPLKADYIPKKNTLFLKPLNESINLGFFGFFQWGGKDFDAMLNVARSAKATLVGSVATSSEYDLEKLKSILSEYGVKCNIGVGWVTNDELAYRLSQADFYYMPQKDYDHWNNSGSARLAANFLKPILLPPHQPFLDLAEFVNFVEEHDVTRVLNNLHDRNHYLDATDGIQRLVDLHPMKSTARRIIRDLEFAYLHTNLLTLLDINHFTIQRSNFLDMNTEDMKLSSGSYIQCPQMAVNAKHYYSNLNAEFGTLPVYQRVPEIEFWRCHYSLVDFLFADAVDITTAIYRSILKRDPSSSEFNKAETIYRENPSQSNDHASIAGVLKVIASTYAVAKTSDRLFPLARITHKRVDISSSLSTFHTTQEAAAAQNSYERSLSRSKDKMKSLIENSNIPNTIFSTVNGTPENNLFTLLCLPHEHIACFVNGMLGDDLLATSDIIHLDMREIFHFVSKLFAKRGMNIEDRLIIDEPVPHKVDYFKYLYHYNEIAVFNGDAFLINLYRCMLKRNPYPKEMFEERSILGEIGKYLYISQLIRNRSCHSIVTGLDPSLQFEDDTPNIEMFSFARLVADFRNPIAGGRLRRNTYLIEKRDLARTWIRLKQLEDHYCAH
jgi:hypothetical protein